MKRRIVRRKQDLRVVLTTYNILRAGDVLQYLGRQ